MDTIKMDIVEVTGRTLESCKFLGLVPSDILGEDDYNVYVRWHEDGTIRADRSDTDETFASVLIGKPGKAAALVELMEKISAHYGRKVTVEVDPGVRVPAAMGKVIGEHDGRHGNVPVTVDEVADAVATVTRNGRVFVTEVYNFGRPAAFKRAVDLGFLLLVDNVDTGSQWILSAQKAWDVHYANATSDDKARADGRGTIYQAGLRAFQLAWSVQFPDIPINDAVTIMLSGDNDVAYAVERTREDMAAQEAIARGEAAYDLVYGKLREAGQTDLICDYIASAVQDMATGGKDITTPASFRITDKLPCVCWLFFEWDRANIPAGGLCCPGCGSVFTSPGAVESEFIDAYRRDVLARAWFYSHGNATVAAFTAVKVGDTIYRESDGHQGTITAELDMDLGAPAFKVEFSRPGEYSIRTLAEFIAEGYEVIPAAEVKAGRDHANVVKVSLPAPVSTLVNRRKRKATRRNRARVGGGF